MDDRAVFRLRLSKSPRAQFLGLGRSRGTQG